MKKIYFSKNKKPSMLRRWRKGAINVLTGFSIEVFPHRTLLVAEKILATPSPSKNALVDLKFSVDELDVYGHKIKIYRAGNFSRSVVFSHGWSGSAGDFNGYYQLLLERGYNVVTLDHIAHGRSAGKTANLFVFTKAMEQVLTIEKNNSEIAGMIAHSMGASAVINSALVQQSTIPAVLVSPVIPFFESLYQSINDFGISEKWLNRLVDVYQTRYGRSIEDIDPKLNINKLFNPLLTIQDRNDRHIPLETNKQYFSPHVAASLHETEGLGHFRILGDQRVISKAINFIDGTSGLARRYFLLCNFLILSADQHRKVTMHSLHSELKQLHTDGAVDDRSFAHLHELDKGTVFSVFYELRVVLYLAVFLIVAGAGMLLKDNLDRIGPVAIAVAIGVIAAICYYHAVRKQLKGESRSIVGDYVLLLGALLLSADTAFIETEFHLLQNHWALYLPLLAVIHAATAYILESRLVLSVSVAALAGWFGVSHHVDDLFFEYGELWTRGLQALECSAVVLGWRIANSKIGGYPQFNEVLDNYAINLGFWAGLIWCQADSSILYGVLVVTILSVVVIRNGLTNRSEWFVVYGVVYSAIAICIVAARLIDDALLTALVVLSSVIGVAVLLWRIHAQLKEKST